MVLGSQEELKIKIEEDFVIVVKGFGVKRESQIDDFTEMEVIDDVIDCYYFTLLNKDEDIDGAIKQHFGGKYKEMTLNYIEYLSKGAYENRFISGEYYE